MANTSAGNYSDRNKRFEYQVFLSFRGTNTRTFVGHLFSALDRTGFRVFMDNIGLEYGKDIQQKLYEGINRSEVSVVILSPGYADSRWCLDELVKIMELQALNVNRVLPVFFNLEPTVVRNQTGVYKDAFLVLEERFEKDRIEKWKSALKRVADLRGLSLNADRDEPLLVENIIQELRKLVNTSRLYVPRKIVGRDSILYEINMWLQDGSNDVEVGLISGLGGIGKSTVAQIAYNHNKDLFDGCSFLADFTRKTTQFDGLSFLLEQVILDVTGKSGNKIHNVDKGINDVRALLCCRRVLLVLDDVNELKYLPDAFDDPKFFGIGSKIIITTRNKELRKVKLFKRLFEVSSLHFQESKGLLKEHANINEEPLSQRQEEFLNEFTKRCQGLPQALSVMGPLLRNETEEIWENLIKELEEYPDHEVFNVFKLSFECIDDKYTRDLFLCIACFFIGMDKEYSLKILDSCKLRPISGIEKLVNRCLLIVGYDGELMMHQSVEEMGKEIARQEAIDEPERRSKLWSVRDSLSVLQNVKGTPIIRGMRLHLPTPANHTSSETQHFKIWPKRLGLSFWNPWRYVSTMNLMSIRTSSFTMMSNLELLLLNHVQLEGGYEDFPKKIKWLLWPGCPLQSIPSNFNLDELVVLDMQKSFLVHAWKACKYMGALRVLNLSYSDRLVCTPDLSCALKLEWLYLEGCTSLEKVHKSIGNLSNLAHLNLKGCTSLLEIHRSIEILKKLTMLNLTGCESLESFPIPSSVVQLNLDGCRNFFIACNRMQSSVISSSSLRTIISTASSLLQYSVRSTSPYFPSSFYLPDLKELNLRGCGISRADVLLSCAPSLKKLDLRDNPIRALDIRRTLKLDELNLNGCAELQSISHLSRSCKLSAMDCSALKRISYIYDSDDISVIDSTGTYELVEVDYGGHDRVVIQWIKDLDESDANQLGFPNLHVSVSESMLVDIEGRDYRDFSVGKGIYRAGTYEVYLFGDHLTKRFNETTTEAELLHTVPDNQLDIRALNLGLMLSVDCTKLKNCYSATITIKNVTRKWEWGLYKYVDNELFMGRSEITLLSHWRTVKEHREIKPGDLLHISVDTYGFLDIVTWGIKIIYEEEQQQQVDEDGSEQHDDDNVRQTDNSWSNSSSRSQTVNHIDKTTSSIDRKRVDHEEEEDGSTSVSNRYNNIFRSPLDLSVYEGTWHSDDDEEDLNNKTRVYVIPPDTLIGCFL
ncbi:unnamed protein product [Rhodiola kirilowii]